MGFPPRATVHFRLNSKMGLKFKSSHTSAHHHSFPIFLFLPQSDQIGMENPRFDLDDFPVAPQSPAISCPGLDDLDSNVSGILGSNTINATADAEVDQGGNISPELNEEGRSFSQQNQVRKKELTSAERQAAYYTLLERSKNGVLKKGSTRMVAATYGVGIRSIQRLWKRARDSGTHDHHSHRVRNCGRKRIEFDLERMKDIPLSKRTTLRSLALHLNVSRTFITQKIKEGAIMRHTNAIKPSLTEDNRISRMQHCLSSIDASSVRRQPSFNHMHNTVHIDEKWFYLTKKSQQYYLLRDENDPVRTIKNANFIPKVMFLAAVARPRYDSVGNCIFDGKTGVFPLVETVAAVRSSQNRPRGTLEIKPIANITRNVIREFLISKVLPAIANKWPRGSIVDRIFIQQDNAKTYVHVDDVDFLCAVEASGLNLCIVNQPPNSPDLNVLDLGFFRAIQSLQSKECAKSITDLIAAVEDAYRGFSLKKSNYIFLTLQTCMIEVLKYDGSNTYKIPHIRKRALARVGEVPTTIHCPRDVFDNAVALLSP